MESRMKFSSIDKVKVLEPELKGNIVSGSYRVDGDEVSLSFRYDFPVPLREEDVRMMFLVPLVNYSLFIDEINADFPITAADRDYLEKMMVINSREVYVNKILRRKEFYREEFIPKNPNNNEASFSPRLTFKISENRRAKFKGNGSIALLSSGGKDSLLSYGLMKEVGADVYPIYVNESGGHWRTASTAYEYMKRNTGNTLKVWTTIDRFYKKMNSKVKALNDNALTMWSDTYPIQLFIFPVYIFSIVPYIVKFGMSTVMKGDEFDDPREFTLERDIKHYNGIYDQTQLFDVEMKKYFKEIGYDLDFYSPLRSITGLVEERILFNRYPDLARLQRSCHSCHIEGGEIYPCGKCSKCNGVLLFLLANSLDPTVINYKKEDVEDFVRTFRDRVYNLDKEEKEHSMFLLSHGEWGRQNIHVEMIHQCEEFCDSKLIDEKWRDKLMEIFINYTKGKTHLKNGKWI
jgi:hypothetical protein